MSLQYTVQDLNSQPLEHESLHITTRPELPPYFKTIFIAINFDVWFEALFECAELKISPRWIVNLHVAKIKHFW